MSSIYILGWWEFCWFLRKLNCLDCHPKFRYTDYNLIYAELQIQQGRGETLLVLMLPNLHLYSLLQKAILYNGKNHTSLEIIFPWRRGRHFKIRWRIFILITNYYLTLLSPSLPCIISYPLRLKINYSTFS